MPSLVAHEQPPEITFYTNHGCPWAQRVQIALKELKLTYQEIIVDLDRPREQWFLEINPRGVVPVLKYNDASIDATIRESAIVAQFLADARPSHLCSPVEGPDDSAAAAAALLRSRIAFFVDTYFTKVNPLMFAILAMTTPETMEAKAGELFRMVEKEIEPLLHDASPYFAGHQLLTMAEVQTASFVQRLYEFGDGVILPKSLPASLDTLPAFSKWARACITHPSVLFNWDSNLRRARVIERLPAAKRAAAAKMAASQ